MADRYDEEMFLGYVEGDLPQAQREQFEALMEDDPRLRNLVAQIIHDRNALRAMPQIDPPASLRERPVEQLERGMLLGPVEPKRVTVGQHRGRMFLPRLLTYGGLAAMLVLCVGLVVSMLMEQNLLDMGTGAKPIGGQVTLNNPDDAPKPPFTPGDNAHKSETDKPAPGTTPGATPGVGTDAQIADAQRTTDTRSSDAMSNDTLVMDTTATDPTEPTLATQPSAEARVLVHAMTPLRLDGDRPTIAMPYTNDVTAMFGKETIGNEQYIARLASLPVRMDLHTTDIVRTIAGLHSWASRSQALTLRPSMDLLTRTGIAIETEGREETLDLVTDKEIAARFAPDQQSTSSHMPPVARHGDTYVLIIALHEDRVPQLMAYLRTCEELRSFAQMPNTYAKLPAAQPAPAADTAISLENMVDGLLDQSAPPAGESPAAANATVDVQDAAAQPAPTVRPAMAAPLNARKLMAIRIIAVNPAPQPAANQPNAAPKLPTPQALPFKVPVIDDPDDDDDDVDDAADDDDSMN